jgi:type VI secretion system protein ImpB
MSDTFQKEIPRARVNISLELDTDGASTSKELPLKMLVVGDYSNGNNQQELSERERISISKNNLDQVLESTAPTANFMVDNKISGEGSIGVDLKFDSFKSFDPEQVAAQIPELNKMMAMRNLLKDLKSNLLDNASLRKELERVLQNQPELDELKAKLDDLAPLIEAEKSAEAEQAAE